MGEQAPTTSVREGASYTLSRSDIIILYARRPLAFRAVFYTHDVREFTRTKFILLFDNIFCSCGTRKAKGRKEKLLPKEPNLPWMLNAYIFSCDRCFKVWIYFWNLRRRITLENRGRKSKLLHCVGIGNIFLFYIESIWSPGGLIKKRASSAAPPVYIYILIGGLNLCDVIGQQFALLCFKQERDARLALKILHYILSLVGTFIFDYKRTRTSIRSSQKCITIIYCKYGWT